MRQAEKSGRSEGSGIGEAGRAKRKKPCRRRGRRDARGIRDLSEAYVQPQRSDPAPSEASAQLLRWDQYLMRLSNECSRITSCLADASSPFRHPLARCPAAPHPDPPTNPAHVPTHPLARHPLRLLGGQFHPVSAAADGQPRRSAAALCTHARGGSQRTAAALGSGGLRTRYQEPSAPWRTGAKAGGAHGTSKYTAAALTSASAAAVSFTAFEDDEPPQPLGGSAAGGANGRGRGAAVSWKVRRLRPIQAGAPPRRAQRRWTQRRRRAKPPKSQKAAARRGPASACVATVATRRCNGRTRVYRLALPPRPSLRPNCHCPRHRRRCRRRRNDRPPTAG